MIILIVLVSLSTVFWNDIRHVTTDAIWRVIDGMDARNAKKAILPTEIAIQSDIPYINDGLTGHLLDVYYPQTAKTILPVIIYIHGGGFIAGDNKYVQQYCMTLAEAGYAVFNINYRLAPKFQEPAQLTDVLAAMSWVKANCARYQGDASRIVLAGGSAGAYLAAYAAIICTSPSGNHFQLERPFSEKELKGLLLFSGLYDLETGATRAFPAIKSDIEMFLGTKSLKNIQNLARFSVTKNITDQFPPTFISSGEADPLHGESLGLIEALRQHNIPYKTLLFAKSVKDAYHEYQLRLNLDTALICLSSVNKFLDEVLK